MQLLSLLATASAAAAATLMSFRSYTTTEVDQPFSNRNIRLEAWSSNTCTIQISTTSEAVQLSNAGGNCHAMSPLRSSILGSRIPIRRIGIIVRVH
ncbi:hypothetical protein B0H63DRAFT_526084 [Podospora didyma]|uniref:Uncharacterized protein n=1 Tax=Podospora didyma TaxID=330526 RepID=A0AAE0N8J3_9PEZI|nr:hypothetical protein B0H63DRAFT_526084 [Podospora didyma]